MLQRLPALVNGQPRAGRAVTSLVLLMHLFSLFIQIINRPVLLVIGATAQPDNIHRQSRRTFGRRRRDRRGTDHHTKGLERRRDAASPAQSPRADGREVPRRYYPDESSQRPLLHRFLLPALRPAALCGHPEEGRACTDRLLDRGCPAPSLLLLRGYPPVPRLGEEPARKQRAALRRSAARQRDHERPPGVRGRFGVGRLQGNDRPRARRFRVRRRGLRHHAPAPGQVRGGDRPYPPGRRDLRGGRLRGSGGT